MKGFRGGNAGDLIDKTLEFLVRLSRRDRHSDDHSRRMLRSNRFGSRSHRCTGGKAVVHQHDRSAGEIQRRLFTAKRGFLPGDLDGLHGGDPIQICLRHAQFPDDAIVDDANAAGRDGAHGEFGMAGHAKLADQEHIQRYLQDNGDLVSDGDTATRQRENSRMASIGVRQQP